MEITYEKIIYLILAIVVQIIIVIKIKSKKSRNIEGRHVVITGGTSGIGLRIAIECVLKGAHVTVIARNLQMLEKTVTLLELKRINQDQKISYKSLDISKSYTDVCNSLSEIEQTVGPIYMLVNCAGLAICGTIEDMSVDDVKYLMDVNYFGTYYCTRYVLPKMKNACEGIIVMTASQAALFGIYGYGPYAATKFALRGLAETISMECRHKGITVTLALPCDTDTPGFEVEEKTKPKETKIISESGGLADPEKVGKKILDDALRGSFFSILGIESWLITILCCGMAPWGGLGLNIIQALLMGPLRIVGIILQWHFSRIIKNCAKEKKNMGIQTNLCKCEELTTFNESNFVCDCLPHEIKMENTENEILNISLENSTQSQSIIESSSILPTSLSNVSAKPEVEDNELLTSYDLSVNSMENEQNSETHEFPVINLSMNRNVRAKSMDKSFKQNSNLYSSTENAIITSNNFKPFDAKATQSNLFLFDNSIQKFSGNSITNIVNSPPKYNRNDEDLENNLIVNNQITPHLGGFCYTNIKNNNNNRLVLKARRRITKS